MNNHDSKLDLFNALGSRNASRDIGVCAQGGQLDG